MAKSALRKTKIKRGLYSYRNLFLVATEKLGGDSRLDWIAVDKQAEAERVWNGGKPGDYRFIQNTLNGLKQHIDQEL
ncbi:hypothetical protein [Neptuniibacter halophilus]|uniref:hypothetical protein n=1 Tax=Neptuniibacter halophilus TaxID=651666 RepID=UPI0025736E97|nr:hypothetical protein [Neptuniibacter halophilus]